MTISQTGAAFTFIFMVIIAKTQPVKQEQVGYLKTPMHLRQATLTLTESRLSLEADDTGIIGRGILAFMPFLRSKLGRSKTVFDLSFKQIKVVVQGKHGLQKNVLEIIGPQNQTHRIIVKSYPEWEQLLKQKI